MIELRPATPELVHAMLGPFPHTLRGVCAVDGDQVLGIAALLTANAYSIGFIKADPAVWQQPRLVVTAYRTVLRWARESGLPVIAMCDPTIKKSRQFLEHMGFRCIGGNSYEWRAS